MLKKTLPGLLAVVAFAYGVHGAVFDTTVGTADIVAGVAFNSAGEALVAGTSSAGLVVTKSKDGVLVALTVLDNTIGHAAVSLLIDTSSDDVYVFGMDGGTGRVFRIAADLTLAWESTYDLCGDAASCKGLGMTTRDNFGTVSILYSRYQSAFERKLLTETGSVAAADVLVGASIPGTHATDTAGRLLTAVTHQGRQQYSLQLHWGETKAWDVTVATAGAELNITAVSLWSAGLPNDASAYAVGSVGVPLSTHNGAHDGMAKYYVARHSLFSGHRLWEAQGPADGQEYGASAVTTGNGGEVYVAGWVRGDVHRTFAAIHHGSGGRLLELLLSPAGAAPTDIDTHLSLHGAVHAGQFVYAGATTSGSVRMIGLPAAPCWGPGESYDQATGQCSGSAPPCQPGFTPTSDGTACASCPAGTFQPTESFSAEYDGCRGCPAGLLSTSNSTSCDVLCPLSHYCPVDADTGATSAVACPGDLTTFKYTRAQSSEDCVPPCATGSEPDHDLSVCICKDGFHPVSDNIADGCFQCQAGYGLLNGECVLCGPGTFSPALGQCGTCPPGSYSSQGNDTSCAPCSKGYYCPIGENVHGQVASLQVACSDGHITPAEAATSPLDCVSTGLNFTYAMHMGGARDLDLCDGDMYILGYDTDKGGYLTRYSRLQGIIWSVSSPVGLRPDSSAQPTMRVTCGEAGFVYAVGGVSGSMVLAKLKQDTGSAVYSSTISVPETVVDLALSEDQARLYVGWMTHQYGFYVYDSSNGDEIVARAGQTFVSTLIGGALGGTGSSYWILPSSDDYTIEKMIDGPAAVWSRSAKFPGATAEAITALSHDAGALVGGSHGDSWFIDAWNSTGTRQWRTLNHLGGALAQFPRIRAVTVALDTGRVYAAGLTSFGQHFAVVVDSDGKFLSEQVFVVVRDATYADIAMRASGMEAVFVSGSTTKSVLQGLPATPCWGSGAGLDESTGECTREVPPCRAGKANLGFHSACYDCPAGTFQSESHMSSCAACDPGYYSSDSALSCADLCPANHYCPLGVTMASGPAGLPDVEITGTLVVACPTGSTSAAGAKSEAECTISCDSGMHMNPSTRECECLEGYIPDEAGWGCVPCGNGTEVADGACSYCGEGRDTAETNRCQACQGGYYTSDPRISPCEPCPKSHYCSLVSDSDGVTRTTLSSCPSGTITPEGGAVNASQCIATVNYLYPLKEAGAVGVTTCAGTEDAFVLGVGSDTGIPLLRYNRLTGVVWRTEVSSGLSGSFAKDAGDKVTCDTDGTNIFIGAHFAGLSPHREVVVITVDSGTGSVVNTSAHVAQDEWLTPHVVGMRAGSDNLYLHFMADSVAYILTMKKDSLEVVSQVKLGIVAGRSVHDTGFGGDSYWGDDTTLLRVTATGSAAWSADLAAAVGTISLNAIAANPDSSVIIAGGVIGSFQGTAGHGGEDWFVRVLDATGREVFTTQGGTGSDDRLLTVTVGSDGNIYGAGLTCDGGCKMSRKASSMFAVMIDSTSGVVLDTRVVQSVPLAQPGASMYSSSMSGRVSILGSDLASAYLLGLPAAACWAPGKLYDASIGECGAATAPCEVGAAELSGGVCYTCPLGTVQATAGESSCRPCDAGTSSSFIGALVCEPCPPHHYCPVETIQATAPGQPTMNIDGTVVRACPAGSFTAGTGAADESACLALCEAPLVYHTLLQQCTCPGGQLPDAMGQCPTSNSCQPGFAKLRSDSDTCFQCPVGTHQPNGGESECISCQAGEISREAAVSCEVCPANSYCPLGSAEASAQDGGGDTITIPASTQHACSEGKVSISGSKAATDCLSPPCPEGTSYQPLLGICVCDVGGMPYDPENGCASENECEPGTARLSDADTSCYVCPKGTRQPEPGQVTCVPCESGSFSSEGSTDCDVCEENTYCPVAEQWAGSGSQARLLLKATTKISCPDGESSPRGSTEASACSLQCSPPQIPHPQLSKCVCRDYSEPNHLGQCPECPEGQHFFEGVCVPCSVGTHANPSAGASECTPCPAGSFNTVPSRDSCEDCGVGFYCPVRHERSWKVPCPTGETTLTPTAVDVHDCIPCSLAGTCQSWDGSGDLEDDKSLSRPATPKRPRVQKHYKMEIGTAGDDEIAAVGIDGSGNSVVAMSSDRHFDAMETQTSGHYFTTVSKKSPDGRPLWSSTIESPTASIWPVAMTTGESGHTFVLGHTNSTMEWNKRGYWLTAVGSLGHRLWISFHGSNYHDTHPHVIRVHRGGGYAFVGFTSSNGTRHVAVHDVTSGDQSFVATMPDVPYHSPQMVMDDRGNVYLIGSHGTMTCAAVYEAPQYSSRKESCFARAVDVSQAAYSHTGSSIVAAGIAGGSPAVLHYDIKSQRIAWSMQVVVGQGGARVRSITGDVHDNTYVLGDSMNGDLRAVWIALVSRTGTLVSIMRPQYLQHGYESRAIAVNGPYVIFAGKVVAKDVIFTEGLSTTCRMTGKRFDGTTLTCSLHQPATCPEGMAAEGPLGSCTSCPAGRAPSPTALGCLTCPHGAIQPIEGGGECLACTPGLVTSSENGATSCDVPCPVGSYCPLSEASAEYIDDESDYAAAAFAVPDVTSVRTMASAESLVVPATSVEPCPSGYSTVTEGATSLDDCVACTPASACSESGTCAEGHSGSLCQDCQSGYYHATLDNKCHECDPTRFVTFAFAPVFAVAVVVFYQCLIFVPSSSGAFRGTGVAGRYLFTFAQLLVVSFRLDINWPRWLEVVITSDAVRFISLADLRLPFREIGECDLSMDYYGELFLSTVLWPMVLVVVNVIFWAVVYPMVTLMPCYGWRFGHLASRALGATLMWFGLSYMFLAEQTLGFFDCVEVSGTEKLEPAAGFVECRSTEWNGLITIVIGMVACFVLGLPLLYCVIPITTAVVQRRGRSKQLLGFLMETFGWLFNPYGPWSSLFWESLCLVHKMVTLMLFLYIPKEESATAGWLLVLLSVVMGVLVLVIQPLWRSEQSKSRVRLASSWAGCLAHAPVNAIAAAAYFGHAAILLLGLIHRRLDAGSEESVFMGVQMVFCISMVLIVGLVVVLVDMFRVCTRDVSGSDSKPMASVPPLDNTPDVFVIDDEVPESDSEGGVEMETLGSGVGEETMMFPVKSRIMEDLGEDEEKWSLPKLKSIISADTIRSFLPPSRRQSTTRSGGNDYGDVCSDSSGDEAISRRSRRVSAPQKSRGPSSQGSVFSSSPPNKSKILSSNETTILPRWLSSASPRTSPHDELTQVPHGHTDEDANSLMSSDGEGKLV